jgi:hypothetical protein
MIIMMQCLNNWTPSPSSVYLAEEGAHVDAEGDRGVVSSLNSYFCLQVEHESFLHIIQKENIAPHIAGCKDKNLNSLISFSHGSVHVGFVVYKLGQDILRDIQFYTVSIVLP